jgi:hypothetical protein
MILSKLPFVLTTIGEQDQARMIVAAMIYAQDGSATLRSYGLFTSPLWVAPFAGLSFLFGASAMLQISNLIGWLAGGATTLLVFLLLRQLGASVAWSAAGAILAGWVPGTFYSSLYGYPSQFALPFLLAATVAFVTCLDSPPGRRLRWFVVACGFYTILMFLKVDFALSGTLLVSVAVLRRRWRNRWMLALPTMVVCVALLFWLVQKLLVQQGYGEFVQTWSEFHPGRPGRLLSDHSLTILYGCGWMTLILWFVVLAVRVVWRRQSGEVLREGLAWAVATTPLWLFWLLHPPMSTRHALPGILLTSLFATLGASRLLPRPIWALLWVVAVLGGNALFGAPGFDINYDPSGRLFTALRVNQRAYAVGGEIARAVAERRENVKVVYGELQPEVLGGLDFHPLIEFALACQARSVRCQKQYTPGHWQQPRNALDLVFTFPDGHVTRLYRVADLSRYRDFQAENTGFYAPWGTGGSTMQVPVTSFDPLALYRELQH